MDAQATISGTSFKAENLVWAKMKGFPPWPAKVMVPGEDTPAGRIPVMFFGTGETAFMKPSDISDYISNRDQYEVPRKQKGFNAGVREIQVAAGIVNPPYKDQMFIDSDARKSPSPTLPATTTNRQRTMSGASGLSARVLGISSDVMIGGVKRSNSLSTVSRSRASSTARSLKHLKKMMSNRKRVDSESSGGSRRNKMISGMCADIHDHFQQTPDFLLNDQHMHFNMHADHGGLGLGDDNKSTRSKRSRGSSKVFEDFIVGMGGPSLRHRSGSHSERGNRSRLISGVSDVFDDLFPMGNQMGIHTVAEHLFNTLDELPSESSERPGTPEAPGPLPPPVKFCSDCGCECQRQGNNWRCTSKFCLKYNGCVDQVENMSSNNIFMPAPMETFETKPATRSGLISEMGRFSSDESGEDRPFQKHRAQERIKKSSHTALETKPLKKEIEMKPDISQPRKSVRDRIREEFEKEVKPIMMASERERKRHGDRGLGEGTSAKRSSDIADSSAESVLTATPSFSLPTSGSPVKRARPKQYKVEKTPPIGPNGLRNCSFCGGQVRPQMCGGNKHRWRCVDKKCRKWYGWVRTHEEIPGDLGRKRKHKEILRGKHGKVFKIPKKEGRQKQRSVCEPGSFSSQGEAAAAAAGTYRVPIVTSERADPRISGPSMYGSRTMGSRTRGLLELASSVASDDVRTPESNALRKAAIASLQHQNGKKRLGRPPKTLGLKIKLKSTLKDPRKDEVEEKPKKRKYTKRKDREAATAQTISSVPDEPPKCPPSPLTGRQIRYRPCAMEKRARWWISEKRKQETTPERELQATAADAAAAFRVMSHAFRAAAVTRADEVGTVNGSLDILMDSLLGSMAPLLSLLGRLPKMRPEKELMEQLWNSSAVHIPMFQ